MGEKRRDYISWDEYFMSVAKLAGCGRRIRIRRSEPAFVSQDNKILSMGYNGFPKGCSDDEFPWAREGQPLDTKYLYVVHSELNAILNYREAVWKEQNCMYLCSPVMNVPRRSSSPA